MNIESYRVAMLQKESVTYDLLCNGRFVGKNLDIGFRKYSDHSVSLSLEPVTINLTRITTFMKAS